MVQHVSDLVKIAGQTVERTTLTGLQNASQKSGGNQNFAHECPPWTVFVG